MATPSTTDQPRTAHIVIYMDAGARDSGKPHPVTRQEGENPFGLREGDPLDAEAFPLASHMLAGNAGL